MRRAGEAFRNALATTVVLVLAGLAYPNHIHRSAVDPGFPNLGSHYLPARGFPFGWLVTSTQIFPNPHMPVHERVLVSALLLDLALVAVLVFPLEGLRQLVMVAWARRRKLWQLSRRPPGAT